MAISPGPNITAFPIATADAATNAADIRTAIGANNATNLSSGTVAVARGGTGRNTLAAGQLLVGNATGPVNTLSLGDGVSTALSASTNTGDGILTLNGLEFNTGSIRIGGPLSFTGESASFAGEVTVAGNFSAPLNANNIAVGIVGVPFGGTGVNSFTEGSIVLGGAITFNELIPGTGVATALGTNTNTTGGIVTPAGLAGATLPASFTNLSATGTFLLPDGTTTNPSMAFASESNLGWFRNSSGRMSLARSGVEAFRIETGGVFVFGTNPSVNLGASSDVILIRDGAAGNLQMGNDNANTATPQVFKAHDVTTGTGASLTLAGGKGGTTGGSLILATSLSNGAPVARLTINAGGAITVATQFLVSAGVTYNTYTVATFPTIERLMAVVTDALSPVAGDAAVAGGSARALVMYSGTTKTVISPLL